MKKTVAIHNLSRLERQKRKILALAEVGTLLKAIDLICRVFYLTNESEFEFSFEVTSSFGLEDYRIRKAFRYLHLAGICGEKKKDRVVLTKYGRSLVESLWPFDQLPNSHESRRVMGWFHGQDCFPICTATPKYDLIAGQPQDSQFATMASAHNWTYSAWVIYDDLRESRVNRFLVRVDSGRFAIFEQRNQWGDKITDLCVGPGSWLAVDFDGKIVEVRHLLHEVIFLILMGAA